MKLHVLAFTERGMEVARQLAAALDATAERCGASGSLGDWTAEHFLPDHGLIFVGAAGIAVRAIAPLVKSKARDPAVVVVDEAGRFAIPILSGHLGGANDLSREIGKVLGATPVITTATDVRGVFAVDQWARRQGLRVLYTAPIRAVSAALLAGETISLSSAFPIRGTPPAGVRFPASPDSCQVRVDVCPGDPGPEGPLCLVPPIAVLGVGCRKGISRETLETALARLRAESGLALEAIREVATLDRKAEEPGLLEFCGVHRWPLRAFPPEDLAALEGSFTASSFVKEITGVDNVCERAAALASGGALLLPKHAGEGVTLAVALAPLSLSWEERV